MQPLDGNVRDLSREASACVPDLAWRNKGEARNVLKAAHLTHHTKPNLKQTLNLPAPVCLGKPGMLLDATPTTTASLALLQICRNIPEHAQLARETAHIAELMRHHWCVAQSAVCQHRVIPSDYSPLP